VPRCGGGGGRARRDGRAPRQVPARRFASRRQPQGEGSRVRAPAALARLLLSPMAATKTLMVETGGWGGIAHYTWNLCAALARAGVEVALLTNREWELARLSSDFAADRCFSAGAGSLATLKALRGPVSSPRPDVVHVPSRLSPR